MNSDRQQALDYLRAPAGGLWRWEENGSVVVWRDGSTIAFREEIGQILERLGPDKLPFFGSLVFLLAACKSRVLSCDEVSKMESPILPEDFASEHFSRESFVEGIGGTLLELNKVRDLPNELISGIPGKGLLAEAVLEIGKSVYHKNGAAVLRGLQENFQDKELNRVDEGEDPMRNHLEITIASEGMKFHTLESLQLRLRTGLDALPVAVALEVPAALLARRLIEELDSDPEHGLVARVAHDLMAAVRLPRQLQEQDPLAIGGVADIFNRGPLDRLLVSELAHDDLTLAIRVALNEALYLRREPPQREPPRGLVLLLDSSLRLWGIPRVLAAGVALALAAREGFHTEVLAWRASGKTLVPIDLLSSQGLKKHLSALEVAAHPGLSLTDFAEALKERGPHRSVLITHCDVLADPEFRQALQDSPEGLSYIAVVNGAGRFELHAMPLARRSPLCQADLDLEALMAENPTGVPLRDPEISLHRPAMLDVEPDAFVYPLNGKVEFWTKNEENETLAIMRDRRLVKYCGKEKGGTVVATGLPYGATLWMEEVDGVVHLVREYSHENCLKLVTVNGAGQAVRVVELARGGKMLAAHRYGDVLLLVRNHDVRAHSLLDGQHLAHIMNPHQWVHGRYFRGEKGFFFALWDGGDLRFEPVSLPRNLDFQSIRVIFDRQGMLGPWLIYEDKELLQVDTNERLSLQFSSLAPFLSYDKTVVTLDGHRMYVPYRKGAKRDGYGVLYGFKLQIVLGEKTIMNFDPPPPLPTRNRWSNITALGIHDSDLVFRGRKSYWHKLEFHEPGGIRINDCFRSNISCKVHVDISKNAPQGTTKLLEVQWKEGTRAFLDGNKVLHLKSSDASLAEVSLILSDGEVAGWTSNGWVCGPKFFFSQERESHPENVYQCLKAIIERL